MQEWCRANFQEHGPSEKVTFFAGQLQSLLKVSEVPAICNCNAFPFKPALLIIIARSGTPTSGHTSLSPHVAPQQHWAATAAAGECARHTRSAYSIAGRLGHDSILAQTQFARALGHDARDGDARRARAHMRAHRMGGCIAAAPRCEPRARYHRVADRRVSARSAQVPNRQDARRQGLVAVCARNSVMAQFALCWLSLCPPSL